MAEVGRPPVLRGRQDLVYVAGQLVEIQGRELLGVVEILAPRIGGAVRPSQDPQVEPVGPPVEFVPARRRFLAPPQRVDSLVVRPVDVSVRVPRHGTPSGRCRTSNTKRTAYRARVPPGHRHNRVLVVVHDQYQLAPVSTFDLPNTAQVHDVPAVYSQE